MTIKISSKTSPKKVRNALIKISKERIEKGFDPKNYFGKLVRGLDGLTYQKSVRIK